MPCVVQEQPPPPPPPQRPLLNWRPHSDRIGRPRSTIPVLLRHRPVLLIAVPSVLLPNRREELTKFLREADEPVKV